MQTTSSRTHLLALGAILLFFGFYLCRDINRSWTDNVDFNGAVWSQAAHNILRAGLLETQGASTAFYFGPLPIPDSGYYLHHPPLLHLGVTAMFSIFGEREWAARLIPIVCSLTSVLLLWLLVADCLGAEVATISAAVFVSLPMALWYGTMVNFEPVVHTLVLFALLCLRLWKKMGRRIWMGAFWAAMLTGMWVDWPMYLFALVLFVWWASRPDRETRRRGWLLLGICVVSSLLFLLCIQMLRPDALSSLFDACYLRIASNAQTRFTQWQWASRVGGSILRHYLPYALLASAGGAVIAICRRKCEGVGWIGWACLVVFAMDCVFVGVFQNDSYIHDYISYYFTFPVSIMAGIALHEMARWLGSLFQGRWRMAVTSAMLALLMAGIANGVNKTQALRRHFCILDYNKNESAMLIPSLGGVIKRCFSPRTRVLCNFMPCYGPHLSYYAKREIMPNLCEPEHWKPVIEQTAGEIGGVVWMGDDDAKDILATLPPGKKEFVQLENENFCVWIPARQSADKMQGVTHLH